MNNNSILYLANWEVDKLAKEPGFLIRPVEPQPLRLSKDSPLDGKWLAKNFKVNEVPLLLPTIGDLPMEFPWGRVGEILPTSDNSLQLVIASIDVGKLNQISLEVVQMTGINFQTSTIPYSDRLYIEIQKTSPEIKLDSWMWIIKTVPISPFN
ncbi:hypothetical protein H6S82_01660 [Planktothrix sp. FACHB-1355]|uniref:hypothetical protein n=1 Tax=Planktothrix sp. FACHB-1355 TaxID=2692854 RepID=UPI00168B4C88|nr:hypothetical protein [Planktothrix sp. FACHB-1355]MBD3557575.1 hypothetical protein [Planktothrix sp. FACHB-1355]